MRWVFISLVVANIAAAVFFLVLPAKDDSAGVLVAAAAEGEQLLLLSEMEQSSLAVPEQRLQVPVEVESAEQPLCTLVGPFSELLPAEYFVEHLAALDIVGKVEPLEVSSGEGFWVYQEPLASRKEALRRLHVLQAAGLDSYVIPKGELENGVSFGFFTQRQGADARRAEVEARGHEVALKEVSRSYEEIWVVMQAPEAAKIGDELWLRLLNRGENLEMRQNFCPAVASVENFL